MSVIVTVRIEGDPAKFEEAAESNRDAIHRIMEVAKGKGLIAHRWYGADGAFMAVDEWPDAESFNAFFDGPEAQEDIGAVMQAAGVASPPQATVWRKLDVDDEYGWED
jgi:heme-degrading monooxygenase HmoA